GPGLTGMISEPLHGVRPGEFVSLAVTFVALSERLFPVFRLPVAALIHKRLELPVGDLVAVDQVVSQVERPEISEAVKAVPVRITGNAHHARRKAAFGVERKLDPSLHRVTETFHGRKSLFGNFPAEELSWQPDLAWRPAERPPLRLRSVIRLDI